MGTQTTIKQVLQGLYEDQMMGGCEQRLRLRLSQRARCVVWWPHWPARDRQCVRSHASARQPLTCLVCG